MSVKKALLTLITAGMLITGTGQVFAQQYYGGYYYPQPNYYNNYNQGYYNDPGYQQIYYSDPYNQPVYQNGYYNDGSRSAKIKKVLTYSAIGAGAGYLLSKDGNKKRNALTGAGIGAALGLFLGR